MRKSGKVFLSSALAVTLTATSVLGMNPTAYAQSTPVEMVEIISDAVQNNVENVIAIHAKGSDLKLHSWNGQNSYTTWPGQAMEADSVMGSGWCYGEVPSGASFLIVQGSGTKVTPEDVTGMSDGEYWFVDGKFLTENPEGGSANTTTPTTTAPADEDKATATPTVAPVEDGVKINSVTPADKAVLKVGVAQTITVDAESSIGDKVVYYKYEVVKDGAYVGDHYYSKANTYTFTPDAEGTYEVTVSVQAHDEENTTKQVKYTYTVSADGDVVTPAPGADNNGGNNSGDNNGGNNGGNDNAGDNNGGNDNTNTNPGQTTPPVKTAPPANDPSNTTPGTTTTAPGNNTQRPGDMNNAGPDNNNNGGTNNNNTNTNTATNAPSGTPTVAPSASPSATPAAGNTNNNTQSGNVEVTSFEASKTGTIKAGTKITLSAQATGGVSPYTYEFSYIRGSEEKVIREANSSNECTWTPKKSGSYTLIVTVADGFNDTATKEIADITVKGLSLKAGVNKKSPQKKKKTIKISAKASNASGKVTYKYTIKRGSKITSKKTTSANVMKWTPTKAGLYTISITAKDSVNSVTIKKTFRIK